MSEMILDTDMLRRSAAELELELTPGQLEQFSDYAALLVEWNQKMNLTAIVSPDGIAVKHFADSLTLLRAVDLPQKAALIDVGTGAGFPGIPLLILRPDLRVTLLDSLNKRLSFLEAVLAKLSLTAETVHARAEEAARQPKYRQRFDLATARAVAPLNVLVEYCLPFVREGGSFAAMKGPSCGEELAGAENALKVLGGKPDGVSSFTLADGAQRNIALCKKIAPTPPKYPRQSAKISKMPL